jgi:CHAT domain-containing protein
VVLQSILPKAIVFTEANATENLIKTSQSPRILHLATHGFFLPNQGKIKNPLLRSGLVLAGANLYDSGDEDGILTALEASGLDLRGTQLVVMSACETGLGEVTDGEGVYGLRRAFTLAGVESQVMSLWSVSDDATQALMGQFYGHLVQDHQGRSEALRQAQLTLLANPQTANPYYWAAFIPSGNWQKIR